MAWNTPGTATAGNVLTAAFWNQQVRDNFNAVAAPVPARSTIATTASTTSTTFTDTGLTVTITPNATTSLVEVSFMVWLGATTTALGSLNLVRAGVNIAQGATCTAGNVVTSGRMDILSFSFIDAPATTSATIYKLQWKTSTGTLYINRRGDANDINPFSYLSAREIIQ